MFDSINVNNGLMVCFLLHYFLLCSMTLSCIQGLIKLCRAYKQMCLKFGKIYWDPKIHIGGFGRRVGAFQGAQHIKISRVEKSMIPLGRLGDVKCKGGSVRQWCHAYQINPKKLWGPRLSILCPVPSGRPQPFRILHPPTYAVQTV